MKYYVVHYHPDGLVMSERQRALLFLTGNVLGVAEVPLPNHRLAFGSLSTGEGRLPHPKDGIAVVLWGFRDNPDIAEGRLPPGARGDDARRTKEEAADLFERWLALAARELGEDPLPAVDFVDALAYCEHRRPVGCGRWEVKPV